MAILTEPVMQLSRMIPAHRKTVRFIWCKRDWMNYGIFKKCRDNANMSNPYSNCWWCKRKFQPDDMINLVSEHKGGNHSLCDTCADELTAPSEG